MELSGMNKTELLQEWLLHMIYYYQHRSSKADYLQLEEYRSIEKHLKNYGYEQTKNWLKEGFNKHYNPDKKIVRIILQPHYQTSQKMWNIEHKNVSKVKKYERRIEQPDRNTLNAKDQKPNHK